MKFSPTPLPRLIPRGANKVIIRGGVHATRPVFALSMAAAQQGSYSEHLASSIVFISSEQQVLDLYHDMSGLFQHICDVGTQREGRIINEFRESARSNVLASQVQEIQALHHLIQGVPMDVQTTAKNLINLIIRYTSAHDSSRTIKKNDQFSLISIINWLEESGYESEQQALFPGSYHRFGGYMDIYSPMNKFPVRFTFLGETLESIHEFNPLTKALGKTLDQAILFPIVSRATSQTDSPNSMDSIDSPQVKEKVSTLFKQIFIHKPLLAFDGEESYLSFRAFFEEKLREPFPESIPILLFEDNPLLTQHDKSFHIQEADVQALGQQVMSKGKMFSEATIYKKNGYRIMGSGSESNYEPETAKLIDMLFPGRATPIPSFSFPSIKLVYLNPNDALSGGGQRQKSNSHGVESKKKHRLFIAQLKVNDLVVHLDHGIGKFIGTTTRQIDDMTREYFIIQYGGGDKIFVPVEYAEKIHRYIGSPNPTLHGLAQSNWHQTIRKVKEESQKIARELLKLYSQREAAQGVQFVAFPALEEALKESFAYAETPDQTRAIEEILEDMEKSRPMDRLLCGDVGFGKTEVAIRAAYRAVLNGKQVAVLCPTTILTQQHLDTFKKRLEHFSVRVASLSRFISPSEQKRTIEDLKQGRIDVVIGTHRILSKDVEFKDLGFVVIDEEQRFGVMHKEKLKALRTNIDILTLTATPIPRTLNLALSGARDISTIETAPIGRLPIDTTVIPYDRELIRREIKRALSERDQMYVLYNRVETIEGYRQQLHELVPEARIGIAHGQMPEKKLAHAMEEFDTGKTDILLCTTIIENGLDLPNANTLIVHNAPMFGLAQLYQIRGRIGRSSKQARAFFFYSRKKLTGVAKERLVVLKEATEIGSGLQIATRDLEIRGAGSILGKEQSGNVSDVGLQMYSEMIQQSVEELEQPLARPVQLDSVVELPMEAYIPRSVTANEDKRYELYQELGNMRTVQELAQKKTEIVADHRAASNELPLPLHNFFDLLEIKLSARKARIMNITSLPVYGGGDVATGQKRLRLSVEFAETPDPRLLQKLLQKNGYWRINGNTMKIDLEYLGKNWIGELKKTIQLFIV